MARDDLRPRPPLLLFDDDDWLEVYDDIQTMVDDLEYPWIDEVQLVIDSIGRIVRLVVVGEEITVSSVELAGPEAIDDLRRRVDRFFGDWTDEDGPAWSGDLPAYIRSVVESIHQVHVRRKKRR